MESLLNLVCGCVKTVTSKDFDNMDHDAVLDKLKDMVGHDGRFGRKSALNDALLHHLWSLSDRKDHVRNIPVKVEPTIFDGDQEGGDEGESVLKNGMFAHQDFHILKSKCQENGILFVDPMFPPSEASLFANPAEWEKEHNIEWVRASELCDDPMMFVDGPSRFDVQQGSLGDCWLLAAMANLTLHEDLFIKVVHPEQSFAEDYAGIFHFRLWQYGQWIDVVVDDYLPTRNGKLLYIRSNTKNEFWSPLLEKAYAKVHGSYEALKGGSTAEAMVDFSGGCSETYELNDESQWMAIYKVMLKGFKRGSMMSCFIDADPNIFEAKTKDGLIKGHAYSITKVVRALVDTGNKRGEFPLLRLRNPWGGNSEWKGMWSDGSAVWQFVPDEEKVNIGLNFEHDGEFYMSQRDFMTHFNGLEMCNLTPDELDSEVLEDRWFEQHFHASWIKGRTAGGCRNFLQTFSQNPQYLVTLEDCDDDEDDLCTCLISLLQKGTRQKRVITDTNGCLTIGFSIYQVKDLEETPMPLTGDFFKYTLSSGRSGSFVNSREVSARFKFPPGQYAIIPSTFDPDEEGDFLLRIFTEKPARAMEFS